MQTHLSWSSNLQNAFNLIITGYIHHLQKAFTCYCHLHQLVVPAMLVEGGGGRYNLPLVWDNIIKKRVKAERPRSQGFGGEGGGRGGEGLVD